MRFYCLLLLLVSASIPLSKSFGQGTPELTFLTLHNPPYSFLNEEGEVEGVSISKLRWIMEKAGLNYKISISVWPRPLKLINDDPYNFIILLGRNAERENNFSWVIPLHSKPSYLVARNEKEFLDLPIDINDITKIKKYKYGCLADSSQCFLLKKHGVDENQIISIRGESFAKLAQLLDRNRIDFFITEKEAIQPYADTYDIPKERLIPLVSLKEQRVSYLAGNKNLAPDIISKIRNALKEYDAEFPNDK